MRSVRDHTYIRTIFLCLGFLLAAVAVLALTGDNQERVSLAVVAAVGSVCSFAFVPFVSRLVRWEKSGGDAWNRTSE